MEVPGTVGLAGPGCPGGSYILLLTILGTFQCPEPGAGEGEEVVKVLTTYPGREKQSDK